MGKTYSLNQLDVQYNYEAIFRDFVIYKIEPKDIDGFCSFTKNPILDFTMQNLSALSVVYRYKTCFVLFPKDVDQQRISVSFKRNYPDYHIKRLYYDTYQFPKKRKEEFGFDEHLLFRLMLGSVCNFDSTTLRFHNVSGQIYLPIILSKQRKTSDKLHDLICLNLEIAAGMQLLLHTVTFRPLTMEEWKKKWNKKRPTYRIVGQSMQRYLGVMNFRTDEDLKEKGLYWKRGSKWQHNCSSYLDLTDRSVYVNSRIGKMWEFMDEAKSKLAPYLQFSFRKNFTFKTLDKGKNPFSEDKPEQAVDWDLLDTIQTPQSKQLLSLLCSYLSFHHPLYSLHPVLEIIAGHKTLILFHDRKFFKQEKQQDISLPYRGNLDAQGITLENENGWFALLAKKNLEELAAIQPEKKVEKWDKKLQILLPKIYRELCIKDDIQKLEFHTFHPAQYIHAPWVYFLIQRGSLKDKNGKALPQYHFYELRMNPMDSIIQLSYFHDNSDHLSEQECRVIEETHAFYSWGEDGGNKGSSGYQLRTNYHETLDGFFYTEDNPNCLYAIIRTGLFPVPDCHNVPLADLNFTISSDAFFSALDKEYQDSDDSIYRKELQQWKDKVSSLYPTHFSFSLGELREAFAATRPIGGKSIPSQESKKRTMRGNIGEHINAFIGRVTGRYFFTSKGKSILQKYHLDAHLFVQHFDTQRPIIYNKEFCGMRRCIGYMAGGYLPPKSCIPQAPIIRIVLPIPLFRDFTDTDLSDAFITDFLSQLMVPYIRTGSYTVLPFTFKYLREFARYYNEKYQIAVDEETEDDEDGDDEEIDNKATDAS